MTIGAAPGNPGSADGEETAREVAPSRRLRWVLLGTAAAAVTLPGVLVPEFPAGDLHSHVYNAWLANLAARGELHGLWISRPWTNVVADHGLAWLVRVLSPHAAERIALVAVANLTLWSAFLFCRSLSRRGAWEWLPVLAMLALGWNFHMGFTNWSLAAALSLLAGAALLARWAWRGRLAVARPLVGFAAMASPSAPAGVIAASALALAIRARAARPALVVAICLVATAGTGLVLRGIGRGAYAPEQWMTASGADQLWVFDGKYRVFVLALLVLWAVALRPWLRSVGNGALADPAFAVAVVASAAGLLVPDVIHFPGHDVPAGYLAQRGSLFAAVGWTAVAAATPFSPRRLAAIGLVAAAWLGTLSADWRALSAFQARVDAAVGAVPPGARVVGAIASPPSRVSPFTHAVDRACAGTCFSWGNYEPSSTHFRMRADARNAFVVGSRVDLVRIELGTYRVPELPFTLWKVLPCEPPAPAGTICASPATPGELVEQDCVDPFVRPGKRAAFERCGRVRSSRSESDATAL